jgi:2-polyprenyl-3-methyl-5-hydroxy-6-metoxy-1,4-benzoquinol methylase
VALKLTPDQQKILKTYNKNIAEGIIAIENTSCLCNSEDFVKVADFDRYGFWHPVKICKNCGLIMHNPHPTENSYKDFFESDTFREIYDAGNYIEQASGRFKKGQGKQIADALLPLIRERSLTNVLEIGCADGCNLVHFSREGYQVIGYDYGPKLLEFGKTQGLDLRKGSIQNVEGKYDAVILNHVAQHFTDFLGNMRELSQHLNPKGLVYVGLQNIENYGGAQLANVHVYYFSPRTLKHYMQICGYKLIDFGPDRKIHMYGIFEKSNETENPNALKDEFNQILQKVRKGKIKDGILKVMRALGLKKD